MRAPLLAFALVAVLSGCQDGPFAPPPGSFFCGDGSCAIGDQFCVERPGQDGGPAVAACAPASSFCAKGTADCSCVASQCAGTCTTGDDGSVTLTCAD
jgi:hypothetical protein